MRHLLSTTCLTTAILITAPFTAFANPDGANVVAGQATVTHSSAKQLDITQKSDRAVIDWRSFNIAPNEKTAFHQPNTKSLTINRVKSNTASLIDGQLTANGNVVIINQNGVWFGRTAKVDVNGLIATTADINNTKAMVDDKLAFDHPGNPKAAVINKGNISARDAGLVGLVAPNVANSGVISAKLGRVQLAGGDTATVDLYGDKLMEVAVSDVVTAEIVNNNGSIEAEGGTIALTAAAGRHIVNSLISVEGVLKTQSVAQKNGEIIISADNAPHSHNTVVVNGALDASGRKSGQSGGKVTITGETIALAGNTVIDTSGSDGSKGTTHGKAASSTRHGAAGGDIKIGGDYLGGGSTPTASNLFVAPGALILNDALKSGDAGRTIFWSNGTTQFYGNVFARAFGAGDGGFVETSGHQHLDAGGWVDLTAAHGTRGTYFLDPTNIAIYGNVDPSFSSSDGVSVNLSPTLKVWLDASDTSKLMLSYATLGTTAGGSVGSHTITTAANVASSLVVGARIRLGSAGAVALANVSNSNTYTITEISGTTLTVSETLSTTYAGSTIYRGLVSQWLDKSGNNNSTSQAAAANMPLWVSNGQNGLGTLRFDGNDSLVSVVNAYPTSSDYSLGAVVNQTSMNSGNVLSGNGSGHAFYFNGGLKVCMFSSSCFATSNTNLPYGQTGIINNTFTTSTRVGNVYQNGASVGTGTAGATNTVNRFSVGSYGSGHYFNGSVDEAYIYNAVLSTNARNLIEQYQSAKWNIALIPPGTGATEVTKATASNGYSVFTTRYLERLSQSANVALQASNDITLDLKGDTLNFTTAGRALSLTAGNQITTASTGGITSNGGNLTFTATNGIVLNHALDLATNGGALTFSNALTLGASQNWTTGSGAITLGGTVNGSYNLTATANSFSFAQALGGTAPLSAISLTSSTSLTLPSISATSLFAKTTGATADITLPSTKTLLESGSGTAITLVSGRNFINAGNMVTPAGRWLVYSTNPANDTIGSLSNSFRRFSCVYGATCPTLGNGNGFLYSLTPILTVTPTALNLTYADAAPSLNGYSYTLSNYLGSDSSDDSITGTLTGTTTYAQGANIGNYNIDYGSGSLTSILGYGFSYANNANAISVGAKTLTATLTGTVSKTYDRNRTASLLLSNYTLSGVFGADDVALDNYAAGLYDTKNAGSNKTVSVNGLTLTGIKAGNYTLSSSSLSNTIGEISQRTLTISASGIDRVYDGTRLASVTLDDNRISGDDLTTDYSNALFGDKNVGTSKTIAVTGITLTGADAENYSYNTTASTTADISAKPLTATANAASRLYGNLNPSFSLSITGLVSGDDEDIFSGYTFTTTASPLSPVGFYTINLTGGTAANYEITRQNGQLTITPATLVITADDATRESGHPNPTFSVHYNGFKNSDAASVVHNLSVTSIANDTSPAGHYAITPNSATADNYTISFVDGILTVMPSFLPPPLPPVTPPAQIVLPNTVMRVSQAPQMSLQSGSGLHSYGKGHARLWYNRSRQTKQSSVDPAALDTLMPSAGPYPLFFDGLLLIDPDLVMHFNIEQN